MARANSRCQTERDLIKWWWWVYKSSKSIEVVNAFGEIKRGNVTRESGILFCEHIEEIGQW